MKCMTTRSKAIHIAFLLTTLFLLRPVMAQTSVFKYQGSLTDGGNPANGSFQMRFRLFDAVSGGNQIGSTLNDVPVTAANGIFSAPLDFGAPALSGANRWLEISVRRNASESYVTLSPREQIASSPYAVRTLSAAMADDSQKLGGVNANEYVTTTGAGTSFIRNQSTLQPTSNFNISGDGIVGGNVGIGTAPGGGYRLDLDRVCRGNNGRRKRMGTNLLENDQFEWNDPSRLVYGHIARLQRQSVLSERRNRRAIKNDDSAVWRRDLISVWQRRHRHDQPDCKAPCSRR
jgi:hypothetical protein